MTNPIDLVCQSRRGPRATVPGQPGLPRPIFLAGLLGLAVLSSLGGLLTLAPTARAESFAAAARLETTGAYLEARDTYDGFIAAHPDDPLAPVATMAAANLTWWSAEDPAGAAERYGALLAAYPASDWTAIAARRRGECLQALERWEEAGAAFGQALEEAGGATTSLAPTWTQPWAQEVLAAAAKCYAQAGRPERVIGLYEELLETALPPATASATLLKLAEAHEAARRDAQAAAAYARLLREYPFDRAGYAAAMAKRELISAHEALDWESYQAFAQVREAARSRDHETLERVCADLLERSDNPHLCAGARFTRAAARMVQAGEFREGVAELRALVRDYPGLQMIPNLEQTLAYFDQLAGLEAHAAEHPDDPAAHREFGRTALQSGAVSRAVAELERAQALAPQDDQTLLDLGTAYANAGRIDAARTTLERYLEAHPNDGGVYNRVGYTYLGVGEIEAALSAFRRYAELAPQDPNAHDSLGEGLMRAGQWEAAASEYERATTLDPSFANSYFMLGEVYRELERSADAITAYERFIELAPGDPRAAAARAQIEQLGAS